MSKDSKMRSVTTVLKFKSISNDLFSQKKFTPPNYKIKQD